MRADQIATHSRDGMLPYLWVSGDDRDVFDHAVEEDESVKTVLATEDFTEKTLYHLEWSKSAQQRITKIMEPAGVILNAEGTTERWTLQARFDTRKRFQDVEAKLTDQTHTVHLHNIFEPDTPLYEQKGLTQAQYEALMTAVETGYYQVPREVRMEEVAEELGITQQSASERLRRGIATLVQNTVMEPS